MNRIVVAVAALGLSVTGCGREASGRFGTDRFVRAQERTPERPQTVRPVGTEFDLSTSSASSTARAQAATAAHGPSAGIRAQMLEMKEDRSGNVLEDVLVALQEGDASGLLELSPTAAGVFGEWTEMLEGGEIHRANVRLARDAQHDRIETADGGRDKIRHYKISFGGAGYAGWIEVKRGDSRWIIVGAGYFDVQDPTAEYDPARSKTQWGPR